MDNELMVTLLESFKQMDGFIGHNGIVLKKVERGFCECEVELNKLSMNPQGVAHGGLIFTLCDVACGVAAFSLGLVTLTLNSSINFMRTGMSGKLCAVAQCIKEGRNIIFCRAEVFDEQGRVIASSDTSMYRTDVATDTLIDAYTG